MSTIEVHDCVVWQCAVWPIVGPFWGRTDGGYSYKFQRHAIGGIFSLGVAANDPMGEVMFFWGDE